MTISKVSLSQQIVLLTGRYMELLPGDGALSEGTNGVTITMGKTARLIPWHLIESVEYASGGK